MRLSRYFLPRQVIVRPRGVAAAEAEIKNRKTGERETLPVASTIQRQDVAA
jgi:prolyl-tRNA synthetase